MERGARSGLMVLLTTGFMAAVMLHIPVSNAGCSISIRLMNVQNEAVAITPYRKSKGGSWKRMDTAGYVGSYPVDIPANSQFAQIGLDANSNLRYSIDTTFRCNAKRRYKFVVNGASGNQWVKYYPSSSSWTQATSFNVQVQR